MSNELRREISQKYGPRFGQIAVESGFITEGQLAEALACQVHEELTGRGHRLLGTILFEKEWMSAAQIDLVLTLLCRGARQGAGVGVLQSQPLATLRAEGGSAAAA